MPGMATTRLSVAAFGALVAASIAAFFVTQHLKVTTPLVQGAPRPVPGVINPLHPVQCGKFNTASAKISFYLQNHSDDVNVYVVGPGGGVVRTVAAGRHMRKNTRSLFQWDGRLSDGRVAPDGAYYFRVRLINSDRTIDLKDVPVKVKTVPPRPVITSVQPTAVSPGTHVTIRYDGNENRGGTILIYELGQRGGARQIKTFPTPWKGQSAVWDGTVRGQQPAPAGTYLIALQVTDGACNTGQYPAQIPPPAGSSAGVVVTVR
jgi:flagellar hook capping protein FlgD